MRLSPSSKAKIRDQIVASAARAFRAYGVNAVNLDRIMAGAGLTRGAFYAHFPSKGALLAAVAREAHPLLVMLQDRPGPDGPALKGQLLALFDDYLRQEHLAAIHRGCTVAALTGDIARGPLAAQEGFGQAVGAILQEMGRGQDPGTCDAHPAVLALASGAVSAAAACRDSGQQVRLLASARVAARQLLSGPRDSPD